MKYRQTDGRTDRRTDGRTDRQMDNTSYAPGEDYLSQVSKIFLALRGRGTKTLSVTQECTFLIIEISFFVCALAVLTTYMGAIRYNMSNCVFIKLQYYQLHNDQKKIQTRTYRCIRSQVNLFNNHKVRNLKYKFQNKSEE